VKGYKRQLGHPTERRKSALGRLKATLARSTKLDQGTKAYVPLTSSDVSRIEAEIIVLQRRIGIAY